jgi:serine/threonine-protein kinase
LRTLGPDGRYELVELLARDGVGPVWRARVRETGELVAVRLFRIGTDTDPQSVNRITRDRQISMLRHPSLLRVRDLLLEANQLVLVTDLVEGRDLRRHLASFGPIAPGTAAAMAADLAEALAVAHRARVVHGGVTGANVLVAADGAPRLVDLATSRLTSGPGRGAIPPGAAEYAAPEVIRAGRPSAASDVYALGIVLYEMFTGVTPYAGGSDREVLGRHLEAEPAWPPEMPLGLRYVVGSCLQRNPARRPAAEAVAADLRELREQLIGVPPAKPLPADFARYRTSSEGQPEPDNSPTEDLDLATQRLDSGTVAPAQRRKPDLDTPVPHRDPRPAPPVQRRPPDPVPPAQRRRPDLDTPVPHRDPRPAPPTVQRRGPDPMAQAPRPAPAPVTAPRSPRIRSLAQPASGVPTWMKSPVARIALVFLATLAVVSVTVVASGAFHSSDDQRPAADGVPSTAAARPRPSAGASRSGGNRSGKVTLTKSSAPAFPPGGSIRTVEGASAFAAYWFATLSYATRGDTTALKAASSPACEECQSILDTIRVTYAGGGKIQGGTYSVRSVVASGFPSDERPALDVIFDRTPRSALGRNGEVRAQLAGGSFVLCRVLLEWSGKQWQMLSITAANPVG